MNDQALRFGSGQNTLRSEDPPLVTGQGRFTDDVSVPGAAHACFVRAAVAHAAIKRVDGEAARAMAAVRGGEVGAGVCVARCVASATAA